MAIPNFIILDSDNQPVDPSHLDHLVSKITSQAYSKAWYKDVLSYWLYHKYTSLDKLISDRLVRKEGWTKEDKFFDLVITMLYVKGYQITPDPRQLFLFNLEYLDPNKTRKWYAHIVHYTVEEAKKYLRDNVNAELYAEKNYLHTTVKSMDFCSYWAVASPFKTFQ